MHLFRGKKMLFLWKIKKLTVRLGGWLFMFKFFLDALTNPKKWEVGAIAMYFGGDY